MDECCTICADPLRFCAFGPCGHNTICSTCVTRMRLMQNNRSCVICKSPAEYVFVTRYMDEHTKKVPASGWKDLPKLAKGPPEKRSLWCLSSINALFDDKEHCDKITAACSLSHPKLTEVSGDTPLHIRSLADLKRIVKTKLGLNFCDLCIEHRQIFTSEQILYTKEALHVHCRSGDPDGLLAEANFQGHPYCTFCKNHHYDETKLYQHMEVDHYHCFICRRRDPQKHKYFSTYNELEKHFASLHYPCPYPRCLQDKFVAFADEHELKIHVAQEHQEEANMSKAERKLAMALPNGFSYGSSSRGQGEGDGSQEVRPGIVIGGGGAGGAATVRQAQQRERNRAPHNHNDSGASAQPTPQQVAPPPQEQPNYQVDLGGEQFPGLAPTAGAAMNVHNWSGRQQRHIASASFPALGEPHLTKGAKKKIKAKAKREGAGFGDAADMPPAHIMSLGNPINPAPAPQVSTSAQQNARPPSAQQASAFKQPKQKVAAQRASVAARQAAVVPERNAFDMLPVERTPPQAVSPPLPHAITHPPDNFPALGGTSAAPSQTFTQTPDYTQVSARGRTNPTPQAAPSRARADNFPSLAATQPASSLSQQWQPVASTRPAPAPTPTPQSKPAVASVSDFPTLAMKKTKNGKGERKRAPLPEAAAPVGGISEDLRAANEELTARIKAKLSPSEFQKFKSRSSAYMSGDLSAAAFHKDIVRVGLQSEVGYMMELCPDHGLCGELLDIHHAYMTSDEANSAPSSSEDWVPPEAVRAATSASAGRGSWQCSICTLINAPSAENCQVCNTSRMVAAAMRGSQNAQEEAAEGTRQAVMSGKKGKKKGKSMSIQEANRSVHPQNVWTQNRK